MLKKIALTITDPNELANAQQLSKQLHLPLIEHITSDYDYSLVLNHDRLELHQLKTNTKSIVIDFLSQAATYRRHHGGGRQQLIARAVGLKSKYYPTIIDATAGFGEDAFVLACLDCQITMLERSPIISALLENALARANKDPFFAELNLRLINTDAINYLIRLTNQTYPDIIYLDPMFPTRTKSALVKKEMRVLRDIIGEDIDASELLTVALQRANHRVVVKRPRLAPAISDKKPDVIYRGKSCRFDVYLTKRSNNSL